MRKQGLHHSVHLAVKLVEASAIDENDLHRLAETIELLWSEFTYELGNDGQAHTKFPTLVRSETVKLASVLIGKGVDSETIEIILCGWSYKELMAWHGV